MLIRLRKDGGLMDLETRIRKAKLLEAMRADEKMAKKLGLVEKSVVKKESNLKRRN